MVWRVLTKRVEPRALRVMNGRGRVGMKGRPGGRPGRNIVVSRRAASVRRARVCGERVRRASGAQGHAGERASERTSDRGGGYLLMKEDFGWISRTWRALRRIGEVARCGVRTTDQQVGCERRVLTLGARGGRRSTRANYLDVDHTPVQERLGWLWLSRQTASHFSQLDWSRAFRASFSEMSKK